jgi:hypothetical protein
MRSTLTNMLEPTLVRSGAVAGTAVDAGLSG